MAARGFGILFVAIALTLGACGGSSKSSTPTSQANVSAISWPAPSNAMALATKAGLVPETAERLEYHVHSHLDVVVDGRVVVVPAGLGINITDPGVHTFTVDGSAQYGGINPPCDQPCISPLHTHDITGVLHTESMSQKNNTLGQLFVEWNVKLSSTCVATFCAPANAVAVYVNGTKFSGDPNTIPLSNHKEIAVVVGKPPAQIPSTFDWTRV